MTKFWTKKRTKKDNCLNKHVQGHGDQPKYKIVKGIITIDAKIEKLSVYVPKEIKNGKEIAVSKSVLET